MSSTTNGGGSVGTGGAAVAAENVTVHWMADDASDKCLLCKSMFSFFNRKHHCRYCGRLVCGECSKKKFKFEVVFPADSLESKSAVKIQAVFRGKKVRDNKKKKNDPSVDENPNIKEQTVCDECFHTLEMLYLDADEEEELKFDENASISDQIKMGYKKVYRQIIQPNELKAETKYTIADLGPRTFNFIGKSHERIDFEVKNKRFHVLKASLWRQTGSPKDGSQSCIVFLHEYCMNRVEPLKQGVINTALSMGFSFVSFDFSGSGMSEGKYVTLGYYEKDDIIPITDYLIKEGYASKFVLWGEGMGAGAACLHMERFDSLPADKKPTISALVLDAYFPKLSSIIWDGIERAKEAAKKSDNPESAEIVNKIPDTLVYMAVSLIKGGIKSDAEFDVDDINPINYISKGQLPIIFAATDPNPIISHEYGKQAVAAYKGPKKEIVLGNYVPGPNPRSKEVLTKIRDFLCVNMEVAQDKLLSTDLNATFSTIFSPASGNVKSVEAKSVKAALQAPMNVSTSDARSASEPSAVSYSIANQSDLEAQSAWYNSPNEKEKAKPHASLNLEGFLELKTKVTNYTNETTAKGSCMQKFALIPFYFLLIWLAAFYFAFSCLKSITAYCLHDKDSPIENLFSTPFKYQGILCFLSYVFLVILGCFTFVYTVGCFYASKLLVAILNFFWSGFFDDFARNLRYSSPFSCCAVDF